MKFCPNCGGTLEQRKNNCPYCGTPVITENNNQQRQQTPPNFNMGSRPMVERRDIAIMVILTIVTCGIYGIIWFINMVDDVNRVCYDDKSNQSGGTVFLLSLVTCSIYGIIWFYQAGSRLNRAGQRYNMQIEDNSMIYLLLGIFGLGIVNYCLVQSDLNKFSN